MVLDTLASMLERAQHVVMKAAAAWRRWTSSKREPIVS